MNFIKNIAKEYTYKCYVLGRQKTLLYDSSIAFGTQLDEFVYSDLVESLFSIDFNGVRYFITFKDNFIYYSKVYCIRYKREIFVIFFRFKVYLNSLDLKIYRIRLDNKGEYIFKTFLVYLV